eukprot:gene6452-7103_t
MAESGCWCRRTATPLRERLWRAGRWAHVVVGYGSGSRNMHVGAIDDRANDGAMERNEALLRDVLAAAAELGNVPCLIAGDLQVEPERSAALQKAMAAGGWCDAAAEIAQLKGEELKRTCFPRRDSPGRRIDVILRNSVLAPALRGFEVQEEATMPTHRPVSAQLDLAAYGEARKRRKRPAKEQREEDVRATRKAVDASDAQWEAAVARSDSYLVERCSEHLAGAERQYRGRGGEPRPRKLHLAAVQRSGVVGATTSPLREQLKLTRRLEDLDRRLVRQRRAGPGALLHELCKQWWRIRDQGCALRALDRGWQRYAAAQYPPGAEERYELLSGLRKTAEATAQKERRERLGLWRSWMQ